MFDGSLGNRLQGLEVDETDSGSSLVVGFDIAVSEYLLIT
jgi:hypothetical protein